MENFDFDLATKLFTEKRNQNEIKVIPVEELPDNFDRRYLGWLDTADNRMKIEKYSKKTKCL